MKLISESYEQYLNTILQILEQFDSGLSREIIETININSKYDAYIQLQRKSEIMLYYALRKHAEYIIENKTDLSEEQTYLKLQIDISELRASINLLSALSSLCATPFNGLHTSHLYYAKKYLDIYKSLRDF